MVKPANKRKIIIKKRASRKQKKLKMKKLKMKKVKRKGPSLQDKLANYS